MKTPESEKNVPYRKELGNGLVLKTAADEADIQRVADCNDKVFGEEEGTGEMSRCLY